jgi:ferritin-like metal-binding protein YciE
METMINLSDLLKHEILDLYSVEEQIIEALPKMVEKAKSPELKKALREHLKVTEEQKTRLDKVKQTFGEVDQNGNKGFFSRLFGGGNGGGEKCKGIEGIISEGEKIMKADITDEALDAAIIASAQKVEHYEICGYGTARAFARELKLTEVERLLTQTLNEEYAADDLLTSLAVGKLNIEAELADGLSDGSGSSTNGSSKASTSKKVTAGSTNKSKSSSSKSAGKSSGARGNGTSSSKSSNNGSGGGSKASGNATSKNGSGSTSFANRGGSKSSAKGVSKSSSKNSSGASKSSVGSSSKNSSSKSGTKGGSNGSPKNKRATSGGLRQR